LALKVTELMYNPAPPPAGSTFTADDFEFVELQNTGSVPLGLGGVHFSNGITFTFPTMTLGAGERTVVAKNLAAFQSRYGQGISVAGEFSGTFKNSGETVTILGLAGEQLVSFDYQNGWYPITDGQGYSLVVIDPASNADLSRGSSWRPSNLIN